MLSPQSRARDFPSLAGRTYLNSAAEGVPPLAVGEAFAKVGIGAGHSVGEITAAAYLLFNNPAYDSVTFPKANLPLIDFILNYPNGEIENFANTINCNNKKLIVKNIAKVTSNNQINNINTALANLQATVNILTGKEILRVV